MQPPQSPKAPAPNAPQIAGLQGTPQTREEVSALRAKLQELNNQRRNLEARRGELLREVQRTGDAATQARVAGLDKQLLQIDEDIGQTGRQIANAPPGALPAIAQQPPPFNQRNNSDEMVGMIGGMLTVFVLFPLTITYCRRIWKRSSIAPAPAGLAEIPRRLDHMEQAIDAIAVEVERISESQRFMTKLFTAKKLNEDIAAANSSIRMAEALAAEGAQPAVRALGAGEKPFEPLRQQEQDGAAVRATPSASARRSPS
jgi:hypothetical protein